MDRLVELNANVIGIDYLLDYAQGDNDKQLEASISQAVAKDKMLIFSAIIRHGEEVGVREDLASLNWSMQGYTETPRWYLRGLDFMDSCEQKCPFAYLVALTQAARENASVAAAVKPDKASQDSLRQALMSEMEQRTENKVLQDLYSYRLPVLTNLSLWWKQRWLQPILDFSIPTRRVYRTISARDLLAQSKEQLDYGWEKNPIIIASGGYRGAGTDYALDYIEPPWAIDHCGTKRALNHRLSLRAARLMHTEFIIS